MSRAHTHVACAGVRVGGMCGRHVWEPHVGGTCGSHVWEVHVRGRCGSHVREVRVGGTCGSHVWEVRVGGTCGRHLWEPRVARHYGGGADRPAQGHRHHAHQSSVTAKGAGESPGSLYFSAYLSRSTATTVAARISSSFSLPAAISCILDTCTYANSTHANPFLPC